MYCIDCEHILQGEEGCHCDKCGSENVEELPPNWNDEVDGHYEGDFRNRGPVYWSEEG
jgi:hypothetical protein